MIITEIQYFFSKIIRFQAIFKDTVEFTCALEFKISSQLFYLYLVRFTSMHKVVTMQSHLYIIFNFQFSKYDLACTISFIALCNSSQSLFGMELSIQLIILSFFVFGILRSQTLCLSLLK